MWLTEFLAFPTGVVFFVADSAGIGANVVLGGSPSLPHRPLLAVIAPPLERFVPNARVADYVNSKLLQNTSVDIQSSKILRLLHILAS
jgi:hypothetical protein